MARLLYLVHRIPFPPNKGDKIRSFNILKALAKDHDVVLGAFVDDPSDTVHQPTLEALCGETYFETIDPRAQKLKSLAGLLTGSPLTITFYRSSSFQRWVDSVLAGDVDGIVLFSSAMARFIRPETVKGIPVWMDFVDLDSDKWRQYAQSKKGPEALIYRREAKLLQQFEADLAPKVHTSSFVTPDEAALFQTLSGDMASNVIAMPNGVDLDFFKPSATPAEGGPETEIVFTGAMDYWANVDAVTWFVDKVLPLIQQEFADAHFTIVGSKPTAAVRELQARQGVSVTGFVDDIRGYIARADICVAPMRIARGVQNKVLEAMAMGKAVVATPAGYEGIQAAPVRDLIVADGAEDFAKEVIALLKNTALRAKIGDNARKIMEQTYPWDRALAPIVEFAQQCQSNKKF